MKREIQIIRLVSLFLDRFPVLRKVKNRTIISLVYFRYLWKKNNKDNCCFPDTYIIKTSAIQKSLTRPINKQISLGTVIPGNWDKEFIPFTDLDVFQAFQNRFIEKKSWDKTRYFLRVIEEVKGGKIKWGCKTVNQVKSRFESLDRLFFCIKNEGYKSAQELKNQGQEVAFFDDVSVCINRHGEYLFQDGRHRLSIVKLQQIKKVPIRIIQRHSEWVKFCRHVFGYAQQHNGKLYAPIDHPDLSWVPSVHGHERMDKIEESIGKGSKGTVLDIGAHWGYFCHKLEALGFDCFALEPDPINLHFLNKLRKAENKNFTVIGKRLFEYDGRYQFDIVLAFYIFHHFLKTKHDFEHLKKYLNKLESGQIFLSTHTTDEPQMKGAYANMQPDEFAAFILECSNHRQKECLWIDQNGRKLFHIH